MCIRDSVSTHLLAVGQFSNAGALGAFVDDHTRLFGIEFVEGHVVLQIYREENQSFDFFGLDEPDLDFESELDLETEDPESDFFFSLAALAPFL